MEREIWNAWERKLYRALLRKSEGKRPLGRTRRKWEDGVRMDLREIGWGSADWIQLAQAGCCEYGDEPGGSGATELVSQSVRQRKYEASPLHRSTG
jgi:hypothetical protein